MWASKALVGGAGVGSTGLAPVQRDSSCVEGNWTVKRIVQQAKETLAAILFTSVPLLSHTVAAVTEM